MLAARHGLPACYPWPQYVEAGGLMSYGADLSWAYKQIGVHAARILNGDKPNDLPAQLPSTFSMTINLRAAKALQLPIPAPLLVGADQVIE